jgi:hypothetical protein
LQPEYIHTAYENHIFFFFEIMGADRSFVTVFFSFFPARMEASSALRSVLTGGGETSAGGGCALGGAGAFGGGFGGGGAATCTKIISLTRWRRYRVLRV